MYVRKNIRLRVIFKYAWLPTLLTMLYATAVCVMYKVFNFHLLDIPWQPVSLLGVAVAFYVGFKNNGSYDRFWEGRKLWGGIVNYSRTWSIEALEFVTSVVDAPHVVAEPASSQELTSNHRRLVYRQIAWINALRLNLRHQPELWDEAVAPFLEPAESEKLRRFANPPAQILRQQAADLRVLHETRGLLNDFEHVTMVRTLEELLNLQGGCERIKNTPFPRQYAFTSHVFVILLAMVLPLGLVEEFNRLGPGNVWFTIPFTMLVILVFATIDIVGHTSEDPFENKMNDVPMTALCRTIEIDLRQMLGETEMPPKIEPIDDILY